MHNKAVWSIANLYPQFTLPHAKLATAEDIHREAYLRAAAASHVRRGLDEKQSATAQENKTPPRTEQTRAFTLHKARGSCDAVRRRDRTYDQSARTHQPHRSVLWPRVNRIITSGFNATHFLMASRCSRKRNAFVHSQRAPAVLNHRKYCWDISTSARFEAVCRECEERRSDR